MTMYRLPAVLGGGEVESGEIHDTGWTVGVDGSRHGPVAICQIPGLGQYPVPLQWLTEIGPSEPGDRTDWIDESGIVYSRRDEWHASADPGIHWYSTGFAGPVGWRDVLGYAVGQLRQLAEDPAGWHVDLPFKAEDHDGDSYQVELSGQKAYPVDVWIKGELVNLTPGEAEQFAVAIRSAAWRARIGEMKERIDTGIASGRIVLPSGEPAK